MRSVPDEPSGLVKQLWRLSLTILGATLALWWSVKLFLEISHTPAPRTPKDLEFKVLIPAYIISELKTGFQIGAVLFLPFLVIDIVVASVTLSIGMVQLPPVMLSAPFKVLLFVLVDGWNLLVGSLIKSFY